MAKVFKFVRSGSELNLLAGLNGWDLDEGWQPRLAKHTPGRIAPNVVESLPLTANADTHNALALAMQSMQAMAAEAAAFISDRSQGSRPMWWHLKLDEETGEKRALVRAIEVALGRDPLSMGDSSLGRMAVAMALERAPYWEALAPTPEVVTGSISCLSGAWDYTAAPSADLPGDVPARLHKLLIKPDIANRYFWLGFRSASKHGNLDYFQPIWELENGIVGTDTVVSPGDGSASSGSKVVCSFAGQAGWAGRLYMYLSHVTTHYADNFGQFLVLLRAKVGTDTETHVQLRYGYSNSVGFPGNIVKVNATQWTLYDLGMMTVPLRDERASLVLDPSSHSGQRLELWAKRVSGTGSLHLDCLVLVPVDEMMLAGNCDENSNTNTLQSYIDGIVPSWLLSTTPDNANVANLLLESFPNQTLVASGASSVAGAGIPVGDGRAYITMARTNRQHILSDACELRGQFIPRWIFLRGAT